MHSPTTRLWPRKYNKQDFSCYILHFSPAAISFTTSLSSSVTLGLLTMVGALPEQSQGMNATRRSFISYLLAKLGARTRHPNRISRACHKAYLNNRPLDTRRRGCTCRPIIRRPIRRSGCTTNPTQLADLRLTLKHSSPCFTGLSVLSIIHWLGFCGHCKRTVKL